MARVSLPGRLPSAAFFAPSGYLPDPAIIEGASRYLLARGWQVAVADGAGERYQRFAGPDERRLADLHRWAGDPALDVAIAARGGYGLSRLLDRIDYAAVRAAGTLVVGYSDFTAFHLAFLARAGGVGFQGPSASDFAEGEEHDFTMAHFFAAIGQDAVQFGFDADGPALEVAGRLWGGNLSMLCALLGTPYFPQVEGGILFVEDVNEPAYRIERMLLQLLHAGVLGRQRALLLGEFAPLPATPTDNGFDLPEVVAALRQRDVVPVVTGLPFGHGRRRLTLPVGAQGRLLVKGTRALLDFHGHPVMAA